MRSSLTFTASTSKNRTDNDVPHMYYVYGKDRHGRVLSTTMMCTRQQANERARKMAEQHNVVPSAITVRRA